MSIKKEVEVKNTINVKGTLSSISPTGFDIEDEKSGEIETLKFTDFEPFLGKSLKLSVCESVKKEVEDTDTEE